jgi:hypothetical protein
VNDISQQLLNSFDRLPEAEKQRVAIEILRRTLSVDLPALTEEELILNAEAIFLSLDAAEAEYDPSESR